MKDRYLLLKEQNNNYIILIKSGIFYVTFNNDSLLLNEIFNYAIKNNKTGFPLKNIDNIINKLNSLNINYIIFNTENNIVKREFNDNKYLVYYKKIKDKEYSKSKRSILIERINFLLDYDDGNYEKIRCFLDEL